MNQTRRTVLKSTGAMATLVSLGIVTAEQAMAAGRDGFDAKTLADAPAWSTPSLLLYAGTDRLVDPRGSTRFAAQAPAACVQAQVFDVLIPWLTQRF